MAYDPTDAKGLAKKLMDAITVMRISTEFLKGAKHDYVNNRLVYLEKKIDFAIDKLENFVNEYS